VFRKILIANRGEIACRVIAAACDMGVRTVAVYSDADREARHVALADEARRIGPPEARASYLNAEAILAAARETGAEAIHPGYGFLSENEAFAAACAKAGIVFIGPSPEAIAAMGDKSAAKRLMEKAGVPLVPGYHGENQDPAFLQSEADKIGYPVLVKASAGGGGKGMRIVAEGKTFAAALESAKREAKSAFGDDRVLVEKYLDRPRHIEVQVFGDKHGTVVYLFERDCSVQRRHQKVLEEAPAPGMTPERRRAMGETAVAAARAIGYVGAGTVEFIAEQDGRFYFMEMNTRLQVEHPVTEMITGVDLVEWQLRVAAGERLPLRQDELAIRGHAIEARIYAEDPERGFLPSIGTLVHLRAPAADAGVRVDTGVRGGDEISPYYDPMIAKLIAHGEDRATALRRLAEALAAYEIVGVATNVAFLRRVVAHDAFATAKLDTGLIARHHAELFPPPAPPSVPILLAAALAETLALVARADAAARASGDPHSPWNEIDPWWPNTARHALAFVYADGEGRHAVAVRRAGAGWRAVVGSGASAQEIAATVSLRDGRLVIVADTAEFAATVVASGEERHVFCAGRHGRLLLVDPLAHAGEEEAHGGHLTAPMAGTVVAVAVKAGDRVAKGAPLMILEAMKMEHTITAPAAGVVAAVHFQVGDRVKEGADLVDIADVADAADALVAGTGAA